MTDPKPGAAAVRECGERDPFRGNVCQRAAGHDGAHIEFQDNGTIAWGLFR